MDRKALSCPRQLSRMVRVILMHASGDNIFSVCHSEAPALGHLDFCPYNLSLAYIPSTNLILHCTRKCVYVCKIIAPGLFCMERMKMWSPSFASPAGETLNAFLISTFDEGIRRASPLELLEAHTCLSSPKRW